MLHAGFNARILQFSVLRRSVEIETYKQCERQAYTHHRALHQGSPSIMS